MEEYILARRRKLADAQDFMTANPSCQRVSVGGVSLDRSGNVSIAAPDEDWPEIPEILKSQWRTIKRRWRESCQNDTLRGWNSLAGMIAGVRLQAALHEPNSELVDNLKTLGDVASGRAFAHLPSREVA